MRADAINALFELGGALAILFSLHRLARDKRLTGFSPVTLVFFTAWGFWNLHFYGPATQNWLSWRAGIAVVLANLAYLLAMAWYARHPGGKDTFLTRYFRREQAAMRELRLGHARYKARVAENKRTREMLS